MKHGEIFALATALLWTITALSFESASKKSSSYSVNIVRLFMAIFLLGFYTLFKDGFFIATTIPLEAAVILAASGIVGLTLGDMFLFEAFVTIGARITMLLMSLVPPVTALLSFIFLGEALSLMHLLGMIVTLFGIAIVILDRKEKTSFKIKHSLSGIFFALGGVIGQAGGLILSKLAMQSFDNAFAATQIRCIAGFFGLLVIYFFSKRLKQTINLFKNRTAVVLTSVGAFFGPFLGVAFSLLAVHLTKAGIAATLMSIVPVLIIPPSIIINKEKIDLKEIFGSLVTVIGVSIMFLF
jgi:drug/metabolite transporter (DMT)-like permease